MSFIASVKEQVAPFKDYLMLKIATFLSYVFSGGLVVGDVMDYIGSHAAAFGVIIAALTLLTNLVFQFLRRRDEKRLTNAKIQAAHNEEK